MANRMSALTNPLRVLWPHYLIYLRTHLKLIVFLKSSTMPLHFFYYWGATVWMLVSSHTGHLSQNRELKLCLTNSSLYTEDLVSYEF